jgi:hypothetical protein
MATWHMVAVFYLPPDPELTEPLRLRVGLGEHAKPMVCCDDHKEACEVVWNSHKMLLNVKKVIRAQTGLVPAIDPSRTFFEWKEIPSGEETSSPMVSP